LIGGQVQVLFVPPPAVIEHIRAGVLRAVAVTGENLLEAVPDVQRVSEFVAGFEASNWYGLYAPNSTPAAIVERLNKEINTGLSVPRLMARFAELGGAPAAGTSAEFGRLIARETEKGARWSSSRASSQIDR